MPEGSENNKVRKVEHSPNAPHRRKIVWSVEELLQLRNLYPTQPVENVIEAFPMRNWISIQAMARKLDLHRPCPPLLSATLNSEGDVGYCAGMIIADGCVLETCVDSGNKRGRREGGGPRPRRYYSMPQVRIGMEDKESLERVGRLWGRKVTLYGKSSSGNDYWTVQIGGRKANDLLRLVLPYFEGVKKKKAMYLLNKYGERTTLPVAKKEDFRPFGGLS